MIGNEFPQGADKLRSCDRIMDDSFLKICDPRIKLFYELWLSKKTGDRLPSRADYHPEEMKELLPFLFMVDIDQEVGQYRYRLVGTNEVQLRHYDPTGKLVKNHCAAIDPQEAIDNYDYIFNSQSFLFDKSEMDRSPLLPMKEQTLFVPTSSDGETVDIVIGLSVQFDY